MSFPPDLIDEARADDLAARAQTARQRWRRVALWIASITPRTALRGLFVALSLWGVGWVILQSWNVLGPFVAGLVLAYLLLPLVDRLNRWMPRWAAIVLVFVGLGALVAAAWAFLVPPLVTQIGALQQILPGEHPLQDLAVQLRQRWLALSPALRQPIEDAANTAYAALRSNFLSYLRSLFTLIAGGIFTVFNVFGFVLGLLIVPFVVYYALNDHVRIRPAIDSMLPRWMRTDVWAMMQIIDQTFSRYIRGQLTLILIGAVSTFLGLELLALFGVTGVQYILLVSLVSGLTVLLPYVGVVLALVAAVGVGALTSWTTAIAMAIIVFVVKQAIDSVLYPIVIGRSVRLHAAIVLLALVMLSEFGVVWVILAPPLAAAARDLFRYIHGRLQEPPLPAGILPDAPVAIVPVTITQSIAVSEPPIVPQPPRT